MQTTFDVLVEPNRRAILGLLLRGERSVGELEQRLKLPQPSISKHLRVLREAGMVVARQDAQHRVYSLRPEPLRELDDWLEPYRKRWRQSLDALERHLERMPSEPKRKGRAP